MTKTTEELKREMYDGLARVSRMVSDGCNPQMTFPIFEEMLERYLEALRQESIHQQSRLELNESLANGFSEQVEAANKLVSAYREQCDTLRNKLQAFEFANRSAAELLSEALREPSGLRKTSQAIPQQESEDRGSCAACRPSVALNYPSNVVPIFKLIRENTEYTLTAEQFEAFEQMLQSNPASENKALQDLLGGTPRWIDGDKS